MFDPSSRLSSMPPPASLLSSPANCSFDAIIPGVPSLNPNAPFRLVCKLYGPSLPLPLTVCNCHLARSQQSAKSPSPVTSHRRKSPVHLTFGSAITRQSHPSIFFVTPPSRAGTPRTCPCPYLIPTITTHIPTAIAPCFDSQPRHKDFQHLPALFFFLSILHSRLQ